MSAPTLLDANGIRCTVLIDGWRRVSPRFVFRGYDEAVHGPEVLPHLDADGTLPGRFSALLIEGPGGPTLVDAGIGPFAGDLEAGRLAGELDALGFEPTDIRTVVVTHGHADHVGGLVTHDGLPAFPEARHVIHAAELGFWGSTAARDLPGEAAEPARVAFGALRAAEALDVLDGDRDVADHVRVVDAPGHTPGHMAVIVDDALLWAGDAIVAQLNVSHPGWVSAADMDPVASEASRRALLARAADGAMLLAGCHLPTVGHPRRVDDGFAFDEV